MSATITSPSRAAQRLTLAGMSLGFAVVQLDVSVVNVAVKSIGSELGGGVSALQWVVNAYTLAFAAFILTSGAIVDRIGAKRVAVGGFVVFGLASVACGAAPTLGVLVGARAVQGVGAATLVPSSLTLVNHAYDDAAARTRAVALYLTGASLAFAAGPLVGGALIAAIDWRAIFVINVPLVAAGIALTSRYAKETSRLQARRVDWAGLVLAVVTLGALVGATIEGGRDGFADPPVLGGFALAAAALGAFLAVEARVREPMLPLGLFANRSFSLPALTGLLANVGIYGLLFVLSLFFQRGQGLSPLLTGLALLPLLGGVAVANVIATRLLGRVRTASAIAGSAAVALAGCAGLLWVGTGTPYPAVVAQLAALGLGAGILVPAITTELMGSVHRTRSGVAAGTLNTMRQTGSAIGVALFGALLAARGLIAGAHVAFAISVGLLGIVIVITPLLRSGPATQ